jgi:hypothetical protein
MSEGGEEPKARALTAIESKMQAKYFEENQVGVTKDLTQVIHFTPST